MARDTSFSYSFLVLPDAQREAIGLVWDFCRAVDDAVDEAADETIAVVEIGKWRAEVGRVFGADAPLTPQGRHLQPIVAAFSLSRQPFDDLVDGVEMDLRHKQYQTFDDLAGYCRRVASTVGLMCIEIFGARDSRSRDYAFNLGLALQLTNIIRDVAVDLKNGRVYLPQFQHDSIFRRNRRLVAFDMDSTLIQGEVIDELAALAGVGEQVRALTEAAMRGELDFQQSFRRRVALLKGLPESALQQVIERIPLTDGAERLVATLRRLGYKTAILSGGFTFFGSVLQQRLGIDHLHANTLEVRDGVVTGEVVPPIVDGARKAEMLQVIAASEGLSLEQCIAVGDGANDLPMLRLAGLGIAFRAKPLVRSSAKQSISSMGLDGILYLIGVRDRDIGV